VQAPFLRTHLVAAVSSLLVTLASACGSHEDAAATSDALTNQPPASALFVPTTKRVVIEIDYAPGAEPFVGPTPTMRDPWSIFRENARALIGEDKELVVPSDLAHMERLDDIQQRELGQEELLAIAKKHRDTVSSGDTVTFYVVFVGGVFKDEDGALSPQTPGVSVRGTGVIALFKEAIASGFTRAGTAIFMEQATLVHELGHAVGLVGSGIEPTTRHRSEEHGAHCGNPACIMYWKNVLVKDDVDFVDTYLRPRSGILFGPECLIDVRTFAIAQR
jgi:hypothetical protein